MGNLVSEKMAVFIGKYGSSAVAATMNTSIFPETVLTAAALESGFAKSSLSSVHFNFFGIKASAGWKGKTVLLPTKEQKKDGTVYIVNAAFRKYNSPEESFKDYVKFVQGPRYIKAGVTAAKSPTDQFDKIHAAGYATDIKYSDKLKSIYNSVKSWVTDNPAVVGSGLALLLVGMFFF